MLKTSKRYVINTNTVNNYGYRVLSEGVDQRDYVNNPIMLWMHFRATGTSKTEVLCLGNVKEIEIDADGVMTGQPYFDDTDTFAVSIYNKYENGTYNMLSLLAQPLEASIEPEDMIEGQTGPTFTKSLLKEISCVDIGGNPQAHGVKLVDADGLEIKLSDEYIQSITPLKSNNNEMSKKLIESIGTLLPELKLSDAFPDSEKTAAIEGLITLADKYKNETATALAKMQTAENKLADELKANAEAKVIALVDGAVTDRKILPGEKPQFLKLAAADFETTKALLDGKTGAVKLHDTLTDIAGSVSEIERAEFIRLSWDEIYDANKAPKLKAEHPELYKLKFKEKFGNEPNI